MTAVVLYFSTVCNRSNRLTLFMIVIKEFSVTWGHESEPTSTVGVFAAVTGWFLATKILFVSEKWHGYGYNHVWGSKDGSLEVHHGKERYEGKESNKRELNNMPMRHDEAVEGVMLGTLDFINMFVLCAGPKMEMIENKSAGTTVISHIQIYVGTLEGSFSDGRSLGRGSTEANHHVSARFLALDKHEEQLSLLSAQANDEELLAVSMATTRDEE
ncbi:hypothetical protein KI387_009882, partial [Taxus chinensis]